MKEVYKWLKSDDKDYNKGVEILAAHCNNKFLVNTFQKSSAQFSMSKLIVELKKVLGMPIADIAMNKPIPIMDFGIEKESININLITSSENPPVVDSVDEIPELIKKAKMIYSELRNRIRDIDESLFNIGTSNASDIVKQRSKLLNERNPLISLSEKIYLLKEEYFITKKIPADLEELLKIATGEKLIEQVKKVPIDTEIKEMTDLDLHKRRSNIVTQVNRQKNQLQFQSDKKEKVENPLPAGPKYDKILDKIKELENEMQLIVDEQNRRKEKK